MGVQGNRKSQYCIDRMASHRRGLLSSARFPLRHRRDVQVTSAERHEILSLDKHPRVQTDVELRTHSIYLTLEEMQLIGVAVLDVDGRLVVSADRDQVVERDGEDRFLDVTECVHRRCTVHSAYPRGEVEKTKTVSVNTDVARRANQWGIDRLDMKAFSRADGNTGSEQPARRRE